MATTGGAAAYEGGAGGKIRRRPLRKAVGATPYDRPPATPYSREKNGWLSKLVDPASRIISGGAGKIFSSLFRKRLAGAPSPSETNSEPIQKLSRDTSIAPPKAHGYRGNNEVDPIIIPDNTGIDKLEQLLQQKTFTRIEYDLLSELLRSRTVDVNSCNVNKRTEPSTSQAVTPPARQEKETTYEQATGLGGPRFFGREDLPLGTVVCKPVVEEAGSPVELAKAYMCSRSLHASPSSSCWQSKIFREDTNLSATIPSLLRSTSIAIRSSSRLSSAIENGHLTPALSNRSTLHTMGRHLHSRGAEPIGDGYGGPSTSSQWTWTGRMLSSNKQVLKRRSSIFDDEFGSVGSIRRVRQKLSMISPSKEQRLDSVSLVPAISDSELGSKTVGQKQYLLEGPKNCTSKPQTAEHGDDEITNAKFHTVPSRSTDMARKILQQLDESAPSPKEKSSEMKLALAREKSPLRLTLGMLNGRALKSMEDVESPKLLDLHDQCTTSTQKPRSFTSPKQFLVVENGPMNKPDVKVVSVSKPGCEKNSSASMELSSSVVNPTNSVVPGSAATPQSKRAFQMRAPEDSLDMDDDDDNDHSPAVAEKEKQNPKLTESIVVASEAAMTEKPLASPENNPTTTSVSIGEPDSTAKDSDGTKISGKDVGFTFTTSLSPNGPPAPHLSSIAQSPSLLNSSVPLKEQTVVPAFGFGSKSSDSCAANVTFSSSSSKTSDSFLSFSFASKSSEKDLGFTVSSATSKVDGGFGLNSNAVLESKSELSSSNAATSMTSTPPQKLMDSADHDKSYIVENSARSLENTSSSLSATAANIFTFGAATASYQSSSLPIPVFSVSATQADLVSTTREAGSSIINNTTTSSSVTPSLFSFSTSAPSAFKFGSGMFSGIAPSSSIAPPVKASGVELTDSEPKAKPSLFSTAGASVPASSSPSSTVVTSSIFGFNSSAASTAGSLSSTVNDSKNPTSFGTGTGSKFDTKATPVASSFSSFAQMTSSQLSSSVSAPSFVVGSLSSLGSAGSLGSTTTGATLFVSASGFELGTSLPVSAGSSSFSSISSSSVSSSAALFGQNSQPTASSMFSTGFGSASPVTFPFGASPASSGSMFSSSSGTSLFSFTSAAAATSTSGYSPSQPVFGMSNSNGFGTASPGNDQMNVEDSMAEDTVQASAPVAAPAFGQLANTPQNFVFGSSSVPSGGSSVFQFGAHQNPTSMQSPSPFSATGTLDLPSGGSFSLGAGNADKSGRKYVRARRDKLRKK